MPIRVVRLGAPRQAAEGLRIGTVRRPPRGVRKEQYAVRNYFDIWLPELAPSERLLKWVNARRLTPARWKTFARRYRAEMRSPTPQRLIALLAALSADQNLSVGCYCADELTCHRSVLRELFRDAGAAMADEEKPDGVPPARAGRGDAASVTAGRMS